MNKQLVSYYFGGKEGLYTELANQWRQARTELSSADQPLDEVVAGFAMSGARYRDWARMISVPVRRVWLARWRTSSACC